MSFAPVVLRGRSVVLAPMASEHVDALWIAGSDPTLWTWMPTAVRSRDAMAAWVDAALEARRAGLAFPFVLVDPASGELIGSTRFANTSWADRRVEIGWTWVTPTRQRTAVNTEAKRLLLGHAFEVLAMRRVELKTDGLNLRSQAAIERIGGVREGVLRQHMQTDSGRVRDTVMFSILLEEWPLVRDRLDARLGGCGSDEGATPI